MVNLLGSTSARDPFPIFEASELARFEQRLSQLVRHEALDAGVRLRRLDPAEGCPSALLHAGSLAIVLEEFERSPSPLAALELTESLAALRVDLAQDSLQSVLPGAAWRAPAAAGLLLCFRPARSLATGEADVASRGYFDAWDRPPLGNWLSAISRSVGAGPEDVEVGILCWVPARDRDRALRGCEACPSGALRALEVVSKPLADQLTAVLRTPR